MRTPAVMFGESLREAGVLVVVFYGLSVLLPEGKSPGMVDIAGAVISFVFGVLLWWYGVVFEREG
jgi:threonine/homoserine efflux transporter RhtA